MKRKNKVILIGGEHHNGLGLVRQFGVNGIKPYGIIVCKNRKKEFVHYSKYWKKVWLVEKEDECLEILLKEFGKENEKPVIIPWSDGAVKLIDENSEHLSEYFFVPSIGNQSGMISVLMDKHKQVEFCKKNNLKMLDSQIYIFGDEESELRDEINFPVIVKPVESIEGEKLDIKVCDTDSDLQRVLRIFKDKGYSRVLIQEYLVERTEYVLTGAVCDDWYGFTLVSHIRQWPPKTGSGSYSVFDISDKAIEYASECLKILACEAYSGTIDIEIFKDRESNFYVNEINWRCSGRNFVSLYTKVYSAFQYYCKVVGCQIKGKRINDVGGYTMNEATDLRYVFYEKMPINKWIREVIRVNSFAIWYSKDLRPTFVRYMYLLKQFIKRW